MVISGLFPADSRRLGWRCFVGCGRPAVPDRSAPLGASAYEGVAEAVESAVTRRAEQGQVVDVGAAFGRGVPWCEVVGLASRRCRPAPDAAAVAHRQSQELCGGCVAAGSAQPQWLSGCVGEQPIDGGCGHVPGEQVVGDRARPVLGGRSDPDVVQCDRHHHYWFRRALWSRTGLRSASLVAPPPRRRP